MVPFSRLTLPPEFKTTTSPMTDDDNNDNNNYMSIGGYALKTVLSRARLRRGSGDP